MTFRVELVRERNKEVAMSKDMATFVDAVDYAYKAYGARPWRQKYRNRWAPMGRYDFKTRGPYAVWQCRRRGFYIRLSRISGDGAVGLCPRQ